MLELGYEGGRASDDSGWSCDPAAALQTLTAETQVCTCHRVIPDVTNQLKPDPLDKIPLSSFFSAPI